MKKIVDTNNILNKLKIVSMFPLVLMFISLQADAIETWGSKPLLEKYRPNRSWINQFHDTADVIANDSISEAIESCDDIVGKGKYCVVEIGETANGLPVEIFRSRTKLVGIPGMKPLRSNQNDIFIYIGNKTEQVIIEGLDIQGHHVGADEIYGIIVEGESIRNVLIRNNKIHGFDSDNNAHGIAIYGTGKKNSTGIRNIIIEGNEVYSMRTGSSESIVVNGNVRLWEIKNNKVHDVNNIAIDAIGGEGTSPAGKSKRRDKRFLPGHLDAASFGFIEDNFVENMSTLDNPAYDNEESWAAAIYIDGGHHIMVTNNAVANVPWGYETGAENCLTTRHITMTGNSANGSIFGDLLLGGYAKKGYRSEQNLNCNPNNSKDENEGHGYVSYLTVKDNQFNSIGTQLDSITLQFRTTHAIVAEPGVTPVNEEGNGSARGDENAVRIVE